MECFTVVSGHPLLITRVFVNWRVFRSPGLQLGNGKRLLLLNPVPALAEWHVLQQMVCTPTDKGILPVSSLYEDKGIQGTQACPAQELGAGLIEACRENLRESGLLDFARDTEPPAEEDGANGPQLEADSEPVRITERTWLDWTDPAPVQEKRNAIQVHLIILQVACTLQFLLYMAALPFFFVIYYPSELGMLCYAGCIYALGAAIAATFARAWRKIVPDGAGAVGKVAIMLVYPPAAMRAIQKLSPILHDNRHESAVVLALTGKGKNGYAYIAHVFACLKHRLFARSMDAEYVEALRTANDRLSHAILSHWSLEIAPVLHSAENAEKEARCFCPLCGISLTTMPDFCPHCLEVRLQEIPSTKKNSCGNSA